MIETNGKDGCLDHLLNSWNFWLNLFSDAVQPSDKIDGWFVWTASKPSEMTETNTDDFFQMVKQIGPKNSVRYNAHPHIF